MSKDIDIARLHESLEDAWMGLDPGIYGEDLWNPFESCPEEYINNPHLYYLYIMSQPDYFPLVCKELLNFEIYPFQGLILKELWNRKLPMLIASRGASKCVHGDTIISTDNGFRYIGDLIGRDVEEKCKVYNLGKVLNEKKEFGKIEYGWNNGFSETIKIETRQGFIIEGTTNHPIRIVRGDKFQWCELKDIRLDDYIPIDRSQSWNTNCQYLDPDLAYLFGLLTGDGGYTQRSRISFTSGDDSQHEAVSELVKRFFGKTYIRSIKRPITGNINSVEVWDKLFQIYGFNSSVCGEKEFPSSVLKAQKEAVKGFIQGMMDTDGCAVSRRLEVGFCSKSEKMSRMMQFILTKFGIICKIKKRLNKKYNRYYYYLTISGENAKKFSQEIGFRLKRKQDILDYHINKDKVYNTNVDIIPRELIQVFLKNNNLLAKISSSENISYNKLLRLKSQTEDSSIDYIFDDNYFYDTISKLENSNCVTYDVHCEEEHSFISNGFISHNSSMLALYSILRCIFIPGRKVVLTGAGFRQSKVIFEYIEKYWRNAPLLRDMFGGDSSGSGPHRSQDQWRFVFGESTISAIPIGHDGAKVRGMRAHDILVDEFAVGNADVFEHVIAGFGIVKSDPLNVSKSLAKQREAAKRNIVLEEEKLSLYEANQIVLAGTAYHSYNHFFKYWKKYQNIISTGGDKKKLSEIGEDENTKWNNYSIIRIPYAALPEGLMDEELISRSKSSMHESLYLQEFCACFSDDSNGFFKRSLIERCSGDHSVVTYGTGGKEYIIAVDPASEADNFCVVVIEVSKAVRKIVYCWTTTKKSYREELKAKRTTVDDFYEYAARKIITLANDFNTIGIAIDTQGGGHAIISSLHKASMINAANGEKPLWPFVDPDKPTEDDAEDGRHIIELVNFADAEYTSNANHNLRRDFETKSILFPSFDGLTFAELDLSAEEDVKNIDSLEEGVLEIEEMKTELSSIIQTTTATGRDKWDTPDSKLPGAKKGRLRKDRYSALLMANALANKLLQEKKEIELSTGGFATLFTKKDEENKITFRAGNGRGAVLCKKLNDLYEGY